MRLCSLIMVKVAALVAELMSTVKVSCHLELNRLRRISIAKDFHNVLSKSRPVVHDLFMSNKKLIFFFQFTTSSLPRLLPRPRPAKLVILSMRPSCKGRKSMRKWWPKYWAILKVVNNRVPNWNAVVSASETLASSLNPRCSLVSLTTWKSLKRR